jgi:NTP pyrophosphatase (non-canonical NTP hydrolase)
VNELVRSAIIRSQIWLDENQGTDDLALTIRILKLTEEAGEAAQAWIGVIGANPRKGQTHTRDQVAAELADVAITALVAIRSLGMDPDEVIAACATKVLERLPDTGSHSLPPQHYATNR